MENTPRVFRCSPRPFPVSNIGGYLPSAHGKNQKIGYGYTEKLCQFLADTSLSDIPAPVVTRAKYILLDGLACGVFAARLDWSERAVSALRELEPAGTATIWGWNLKFSPTVAALLNGTFVQGFELDDYHPLGPLHSVACVATAVLATAEHITGVDGRRFLEALVLGFEVGPRVGMTLGGLELVQSGWHCGAIFGALASAAGSGKLRGLNAEQMEDAVSIGATQACGLMAAQFEAMVKRMHSGMAARSGALAAALAEKGFTGIKSVIEREYGGLASNFSDGPAHFELLIDNLGKNWEVLRIAIKPAYACMGGLHTTIEAAESVRARTGFALGKVQSIEIGLSEALFHHGGWKLERPATVVGAQMNNAYAAAVALIDGDTSVMQFAPQRINKDDVWDVIGKIRVYNDKELDHLGEEGRWCTRLKVTYKDGHKETAEVRQPWGGRVRPLQNEDIAAKYDRIMSFVMDDRRARRIKDFVLNMESCADISELGRLLAVEVRNPFA